MAQIDVSDLLQDPYLAGTAFVVLRRLEQVNTFGEVKKTTASLPAVGALFPSGDNSLVREEAYQSQSNSLTVITRFALRGPAKDERGNQFQPDIVLWQGNHYIVKSLNNWSKYGAGFYEAECIAIDFQDTAATPE